MNLKVSVIVPIYNIRDLIERCVKSLTEQTYSNLEIILVNDGSTDDSGEICDKLAVLDDRIKVIHQINGGLSDARNSGIKSARGEYVSFVDGDDYLVNDAYKIIMDNLNLHRQEVIICNATKINVSTKEKIELMKNKTFSSEIMTGLEYYCSSIEQDSMSVCAWLNICNRKFIVDNELFFKKGIYHEDSHWTPRMLLKAERVSYIDYSFYKYIVRDGSIMTTKDKTKNGLDIIEICNDLEKRFLNVENEKYRKIILNNLVDLYLAAIFVGKLHRSEYRKKLSKTFVKGKAFKITTKLKVYIFLVHPSLYYLINHQSKQIKAAYNVWSGK